MTRTERVRLGSRSYNIYIGGNVLAGAGDRIARITNRALVVTNRRVNGLYGPKLTRSLEKAGVEHEILLLPDGERYKNMAAVEKIHDRLVKGRYARDALVAALGGGVIGDITGFAAATYMRGVGFVQAPTTLLAQVDSSVGGKTGVNHPKGKNLIGAFHQPAMVLADVTALRTLPEPEVLCGMAEIIKYGCIASARFFGFLEKNTGALARLSPKITAEAVAVSCRIKAAVVSEDEREAGKRAILNFGHTAGHAIEAVTGYRKYRHGYAVAIGMAAAAELSALKLGLDGKEVRRIKELIARAGLPVAIPEKIPEKALLKAMEHDKKVRRGAIRFALLDRIGNCKIVDDVKKSEIREALRRCRHG